MKSLGQVVIAFTLAIALQTTHAIPEEEELTNPFGMQAPEYSPDDEIEGWSGSHNGYDRSFNLFFSREDASYLVESVAVYSWKGREFCFIEVSDDVRMSATEFYVPPSVGGCWIMANPGEQYDYREDLGGVQYGSFTCRLDRSRGQGRCLYKSASTGKTSEFDIANQ